MKTATVPTIVQLEEKDLKEFRPVNETLSLDFLFHQPSKNNKNFGTVDLWNCRNKRRMNGVKIR